MSNELAWKKTRGIQPYLSSERGERDTPTLAKNIVGANEQRGDSVIGRGLISSPASATAAAVNAPFHHMTPAPLAWTPRLGVSLPTGAQKLGPRGVSNEPAWKKTRGTQADSSNERDEREVPSLVEDAEGAEGASNGAAHEAESRRAPLGRPGTPRPNQGPQPTTTAPRTQPAAGMVHATGDRESRGGGALVGGLAFSREARPSLNPINAPVGIDDAGGQVNTRWARAPGDTPAAAAMGEEGHTAATRTYKGVPLPVGFESWPRQRKKNWKKQRHG